MEIIRRIYANGEREFLRGKEAEEFWRRLKLYGSVAKEGLFSSLLDTYQGAFRRFLGEIEELKEKIFLAFSEEKELSACIPSESQALPSNWEGIEAGRKEIEELKQALEEKDREIEEYKRQLEELKEKRKEESQEIEEYRQLVVRKEKDIEEFR